MDACTRNSMLVVTHAYSTFQKPLLEGLKRTHLIEISFVSNNFPISKNITFFMVRYMKGEALKCPSACIIFWLANGDEKISPFLKNLYFLLHPINLATWNSLSIFSWLLIYVFIYFGCKLFMSIIVSLYIGLFYQIHSLNSESFWQVFLCSRG